MNKIKILYTLNYARVAGTEKHLLYLLKHLDTKQFEPIVVCFAKGPLVKMLRDKGIKAYSLPRKKFFDFSTALALYRLIRKHKVKIIHSHCGQFSCVVGKIAGVPHLLETRHGLYFYFDRVPRLGLADQIVTRAKASFVDLTLIVSKTDEDLLLNKFKIHKTKIRRVSNGLDEDELKESSDPKRLKSDLRIPLDRKIIGSVARLSDEKGVRYLILAIKETVAQFPNCHFVIVGDGPLRKEIETLAQDKGIIENLTMTGYRENAVEIMSLFDIFVLPSLCEGMPYTILEAMMLKKPVVASDIFGNRELVKNKETGYLVTPKSPEELSNSILSLLRNEGKAQKMGKNGARLTKRYFSAKKMSIAIQKIYLELLYMTA